MEGIIELCYSGVGVTPAFQNSAEIKFTVSCKKKTVCLCLRYPKFNYVAFVK